MVNSHVLQTIRLIRDSHSEMGNIFTGGSCMNFYFILRHHYPQASLYYSILHGHVITKIDGQFYDITGQVTKDLKDFEPLKTLYSEKMYRSSIKQMLEGEFKMLSLEDVLSKEQHKRIRDFATRLGLTSVITFRGSEIEVKFFKDGVNIHTSVPLERFKSDEIEEYILNTIKDK